MAGGQPHTKRDVGGQKDSPSTDKKPKASVPAKAPASGANQGEKNPKAT